MPPIQYLVGALFLLSAPSTGVLSLLDIGSRWGSGSPTTARSSHATRTTNTASIRTMRFSGQPVQILGMNLDENEKDARFVVEQMEIRYPTLRAIGLPEKYHVGGIPHLVILDREGKIADIHIGYAPTLKERVSQSIREILERK